MSDLLLGIDGGGSKTRALLADRSGTILGTGSAGSSNYQSVGFAAATDSLQGAIAAAFQQSSRPPARVAAVCYGLAGVDRRGDKELFERWSAEQDIARRCTVVNDAELVLAAGTPEGWGVALICGTGSICYGRTREGRTARAGGWGHLLGDEGSGYDIAVRTLRLVTQTVDGRSDADSIVGATLAFWGMEHPDELISYVYRPETTRGDIARLAGRIIELADEGNPHALAILADSARELGRLILAVVKRLDLARPCVALGGGLLGASRYLQQGLAGHAGIELGAVSYVQDPAQGGLVLARRLLEQGA